MDTTHQIRDNAQADLLRLGLENLAYIKGETEKDQVIYVIYAADGTEIGRAEDPDIAMAALRQQGLEGRQVH
ncbi:MAG: hypothetical protein AAF530_00750 [Pseudomonadota bacterium]